MEPELPGRGAGPARRDRGAVMIAAWSDLYGGRPGAGRPGAGAAPAVLPDPGRAGGGRRWRAGRCTRVRGRSAEQVVCDVESDVLGKLLPSAGEGRRGTKAAWWWGCLLYTSPSPRDRTRSR